MATWKGIIGKFFTPCEFEGYLKGLAWSSWKPSFIVLHNTYLPTLAQRPTGLTKKHIINLEHFFKTKGWSAGPHLFIDDKGIWVFSPLTSPGVHSPSWNSNTIGIEMLGDYEKESFKDDRGFKVRKNTVAAIASLSKILGLSADTIKLHKEDTKTSHKTCPGKNVIKAEVIKEVKIAMTS